MVSDSRPPMTDIEQIAYDWMVRRGINFQFSSSIAGGFFELGGAVVDFILPDRRIAIRVMGVYWHRGVEVEGHDMIQREMLVARGYIVVDIWGDDLRDPTRRDETMRKAMRGEEMLR